MLLTDLFFPKKCVGCGRAGRYFCKECIQNILQNELVCPSCEKSSIGGLAHPLCKRKFSLDGLWSLGVYQGPLKQAIQKLKYRWVSLMAEELADITIDYWVRFEPLLLEKIQQDRGEGWVIIPVPLHPKRQNWRGFNQSALLGKLLADRLGIRYTEALKRVRHTRPQVGLLGKDRSKNIRGAFSLTENSQLIIENCILIDDVWTTGSTLKECCYILKRGGVRSVWALTLAR